MAIPSSDGTITAAYRTPVQNHGTILEVLDTDNGGSPLPGDATVTWNVQGPKGDKGDKGDPGTPAPGYHLEWKYDSVYPPSYIQPGEHKTWTYSAYSDGSGWIVTGVTYWNWYGSPPAVISMSHFQPSATDIQFNAYNHTDHEVQVGAAIHRVRIVAN